jgi:hypothetical protein
LTIGLTILCSSLLLSQDLAPRAYVITPIHSNAVVLTYSFFSGNLNFDGSVPISDATATAHVPIFSLFHSMRFFGRTANFTVGLPYGVANFHGTVLGNETNVYRSGLLDSAYRFSVNLHGGPAMEPREYVKWKQKTIIGISLKIVAPSGQYDSTKLINLGNNRWAFKPELGLSRRKGHWIVDAYGGAWFYTSNPKFFSQNQYNPGITEKTQSVVGSFEGHLSYDVRPRLWASFDGNYWFGGTTSMNGVPNPATRLSSSRIGGTVSIPISRHQAIKCSYSDGAYIKYGGNFHNLSIGWQYSWLGRPN